MRNVTLFVNDEGFGKKKKKKWLYPLTSLATDK